MSTSTKDQKIKQYNVTISKLIKLILNLNEEHQEAPRKKGRESLSEEKRAHRKSCKIPVRYKTFRSRVLGSNYEYQPERRVY